MGSFNTPKILVCACAARKSQFGKTSSWNSDLKGTKNFSKEELAFLPLCF